MSLIELSRFLFIVFVSLSTIFAQETLGPWRKGDFAYSTQVADDRPNEGSHLLVETYYRPLVDERLIFGRTGALGFRIAPRNEEYAGILLTSKDGTPIKRSESYSVVLVNSEKLDETRTLLPLDTRILCSDAIKIFRPKTLLRASKGGKVVDEVLVDFTQWKLGRSRVQLKELLDGSPGLIRDFQYCLECGRLICLILNFDLQLAATVENLLQKNISKLDIAFPTPVHEGPEPHTVESPVPPCEGAWRLRAE